MFRGNDRISGVGSAIMGFLAVGQPNLTSLQEEIANNILSGMLSTLKHLLCGPSRVGVDLSSNLRSVQDLSGTSFAAMLNALSCLTSVSICLHLEEFEDDFDSGDENDAPDAVGAPLPAIQDFLRSLRANRLRCFRLALRGLRP